MCIIIIFILFMIRQPHHSTHFPYTTLFRSGLAYSAIMLVVALVAFISANNLMFLILAAMLATFMVSGFISRSEEHTSELQSHVNLVCRLLLEKKKNCISIYQCTISSHYLRL